MIQCSSRQFNATQQFQTRKWTLFLIFPKGTWRPYFYFSRLDIGDSRPEEHHVLHLEGPCSAKKSFTGCLKSFKSFPQMTFDHFSPQSRTPCRIPYFQSVDNGVTASIERSSSRIVKTGHFFLGNNYDKRIPLDIELSRSFSSHSAVLHVRVPRICKSKAIGHNDVQSWQTTYRIVVRECRSNEGLVGAKRVWYHFFDQKLDLEMAHGC